MRDAAIYADPAGLRASDGDGTGQPGHGRGLRGVEENHYHAPQIRRSRSGLAASPRDFTRSRRREMMAASDWRCAPAMPHCIKGGRDVPGYRASAVAEISSTPSRWRGYHLIIYDFRPIDKSLNQ